MTNANNDKKHKKDIEIMYEEIVKNSMSVKRAETNNNFNLEQPTPLQMVENITTYGIYETLK